MSASVASSRLGPFLTPAGTLCALALDHRDALRNAFARAGVAAVDDATMQLLKVRIADALAPAVSALLLDAAAVPSCRAPGRGVFVPLEQQGHQPFAGGRLTGLLEDFGPADAGALGAHGCKLLVHYRADHRPTAERQRALVRRVAADCHRHGLALVVEPVVYRLTTEQDAGGFGELVVAAARDLADSGADLLKLQYAGDREACERVTQAAAPLPWTLLGGSEVDGATFAAQLGVACAAGASGFIAGRAIWSGALGRDPDEQSRWLRDRARPLVEQLVEIADTQGRSIR